MLLKPSDLSSLTEVSIYGSNHCEPNIFYDVQKKYIYIEEVHHRNYEKGLFNSGKEKAPF